ncbi:MAG: hypothetical protein LUH01_11055, partial [Parabacteroides gordonii]|nr:hypothetical protein [Parabacteroides gordonii]
QQYDMRKEIGNALHRASESVPMSDLARKIYYSEESIEIPDKDFKTMTALLKTSFKKFVIDSIVKAGEESETKKDKEE